MTNVEEIYEQILENIDKIEKEHSSYWLYSDKGFFEYKNHFTKKNLCLNIKIKENRKKDFIQLFDNLSINYKITNNNNKYYIVFELNPKSNYIILDYVVNSHITIPSSFLKKFGYRTKDGWMVDYIDINNLEIKTKKTKEYGSEYGYYSKFTEDILRNKFESRIGMITQEINLFKNNVINNIDFNKSKLEDIYNFFDITTYRNKNMLKQVNEASTISRALLGDSTHDQLLDLAFNSNLPHIYEGLRFNIIINKTNRDFIINDTMISSIRCDNQNEVIILPINKKECLALMEESYYKKYVKDDKLYFMNIEDELNVELFNKHIFKRAKENNENVIGTRTELEILLKESYK